MKHSMLCLYFSGTGNTKYLAELFSRKMDAACFSIETNADFSAEIKRHDTIVICYPIYGSRVPFIMRDFVTKHMADFKDKKLIIFVTQLIFSGDGARVLCDLFPANHVEVIYAEHFFMTNNVCNFAILPQTSDEKIKKQMVKVDNKLNKVCENIKAGKVVLRGFSVFSKILGKAQGIPWQGDSRNLSAAKGTMEYRAKSSVKIDAACTACNICVECCPMKNFENVNGVITPKDNCMVCYRCINLCPQKAITVFFHKKPTWQYKGIPNN
jgi:Pyruvate/2-oxoacid:ferredoxin oxidoreductase delta subunit